VTAGVRRTHNVVERPEGEDKGESITARASNVKTLNGVAWFIVIDTDKMLYRRQRRGIRPLIDVMLSVGMQRSEGFDIVSGRI